MLLLALLLTVNGTVTSIDGAAIPGARVVVVNAAQVVEVVTTDAKGAFVLSTVEVPFDIEVSAPGFATVRTRVTAEPVAIVLSPAGVTASVIVTGGAGYGVLRATDTGDTILSGSDVRSLPGETLDESLKVIAGFSLFRRSSSRASNPTTHGVTMRGLSASGSSRGLVLFEGVPLNDGFGGWVTWTRLPADALGGVSLRRGAEGDAYGSDALGGLIRVEPRETGPIAFGGEGGSQGTGGFTVSAGKRIGLAHLFGATSWFSTAGSIPLEEASRGAVDDELDAEWTNGFGRVVIPTGRTRTTISGWLSTDDRGNGTVLQRNKMSGGTVTGTFELIGDSSFMAARMSATPNDFHQTFSAVGAGRVTETLTSTQDIATTTTRAIVEYGRLLKRGSLIGRASLSRASSDFDVLTASLTSSALRDDSEAVSLSAGFDLNTRTTLSAGARHEWRAAPTDADGRDGATVGHAAAAVRITGDLVARGSVATSHRWPTLNELARNFQVGAIVTQANPELSPEKAISTDAELDWRHGRFELGSGAFWTRIDDAIANVTISNNLRRRQNTGDAHVAGLEFDSQYTHPWGRIRGSLAVADATFQDSIEAPLEGKQLPQVPKVSGSIWADAVLPHRITASVVWHGTSSQFDDDRNQFELAPAGQLDFKVSGAVRRYLSWYLVMENVTDARIEVGKTPLVTLAPGRAVRVGVRIEK